MGTGRRLGQGLGQKGRASWAPGETHSSAMQAMLKAVGIPLMPCLVITL